MQVSDTLTLDAPRRTSDGYLAVRAKAARLGIQDYLAAEVGAPATFKATDTVKVYRDASEVFAADSVRSFIGRPITNDHPREAVTAANWRDHARGTVMGAVRDGEYLAFDLVLMDAAAINAVESGKRELSNGYTCSLDWTPGTTPDGIRYDARQVGIKGNHVALVDKGRAGSECAIKDGEGFAICDANPAAMADHHQETAMKIKIGDAEVDATNGEAVRIAVDSLNTNLSALTTELTDTKAKLSEESGKVTALTTQLADAKAAIDPAKIDALVADRAALIGKAKAAAPTIVTDGKSDAEIRRAVVVARLGDACPADDAAVAGAFAVLCSDAVKAEPVQNITPGASFNDSAAVRNIVRTARYA